VKTGFSLKAKTIKDKELKTLSKVASGFAFKLGIKRNNTSLGDISDY
jgi:hypothetical protein